MFHIFRQALLGSDAERAREQQRRLLASAQERAHLDLAAFRRRFEIEAPSIGQGRIPLGRCQDHRGQKF
jgi:hypothetical protein